ncbi:hypothetical protein L596_005555 [Steinernema carpocapsae]|uniref:Amidase domain-containing protein n=1 Tax=Steinernema carpocapsae TaxID=34508 RepID=A0A4V6I8H5_STECR|nr:hypothetical protein L596_005555 [Steinernema carpocapsae]
MCGDVYVPEFQLTKHQLVHILTFEKHQTSSTLVIKKEICTHGGYAIGYQDCLTHVIGAPEATATVYEHANQIKQSLVVSTSRTDDDIEVLTILRVDISKAFPKRSVEAGDGGGDKLQDGSITAEQVLLAYWRKAFQVNEDFNCLIDVIVKAYDDAMELDRKYPKGSTKPALFGIPFSVKGNFFMKDFDCSLGLTKFLKQPKDSECSMVTYLRTQGAIPFVITNVPQALLSFVCSNSVYGTTGNPHNKDRTPRGSSGGEAALVAAGEAKLHLGLAATWPEVFEFRPLCVAFSLKPTEGNVRTVDGPEPEHFCHGIIDLDRPPSAGDSDEPAAAKLFEEPEYDDERPEIQFDRDVFHNASEAKFWIGEGGGEATPPAAVQLPRDESLRQRDHGTPFR